MIAPDELFYCVSGTIKTQVMLFCAVPGGFLFFAYSSHFTTGLAIYDIADTLHTVCWQQCMNSASGLAICHSSEFTEKAIKIFKGVVNCSVFLPHRANTSTVTMRSAALLLLHGVFMNGHVTHGSLCSFNGSAFGSYPQGATNKF